MKEYLTTHAMLHAITELADSARENDCVLLLWPRELPIPFFEGTAPNRVMGIPHTPQIVHIGTVSEEQQSHYNRLLAESMHDPANKFRVST